MVVKVSHLLAACRPLHSPVHASRLSSFKVYYVLREEHRRTPSYGFIKADRRARRLYLTRVYTRRAGLLFRVRRPCFYEILGRHLSAPRRDFPYLRYRGITHGSLSQRRNVGARAAKVKLIFGLSPPFNLGIVLRRRRSPPLRNEDLRKSF